MKRTSQLYLILIIFFTAFSACESTDEEPQDSPQSIVLGEKATKVVKTGNEFGLELFQNVFADEKEHDNIMVSPLSVSLALAMVYNGADNETKTAMEKTLKVYGLSTDDINQSYKTLVNALKSLDPKVVFEIANAVFYREDFTVESDFIATNQNYYDAEVSALDFGSQDALSTINNWVADKTNDKIDKIIDNISSDHVMFLLNAIYFNGIWKTEFEEDATINLPFYLEDGSSVSVPTMQKSETLPYYSNELYSAVELAYGYGNYNMYVFLPNSGKSVDDIVNELTNDNWNAWMENFKDSANVDLYFPRLKYGYEIYLNDVLSDMGMSVAFAASADFTGINKTGNLCIDYVKHKTFIEVNEKGTEAAAVTVVAVMDSSAGGSNLSFNVNRPFFYAITEKDTDAILFMGTVKNPESEE